MLWAADEDEMDVRAAGEHTVLGGWCAAALVHFTTADAFFAVRSRELPARSTSTAAARTRLGAGIAGEECQ